MNKQINLFLFDDGIRKKLSFISTFTEITFPEAITKGYLTVRIFKVLLCLSEGKCFDFILAHLFLYLSRVLFNVSVSSTNLSPIDKYIFKT